MASAGTFRVVAFCLQLIVVFQSCKRSTSDYPWPNSHGILFPFRLSTPVDSGRLSRATSLFIDSKDVKWITFNDHTNNAAIVRFDGNTGDVYPNATSSLELGTYNDLAIHAEDEAGRIYVTAKSSGRNDFILLRYENGNWNSWNVDGIACKQVYFNGNDNKLYFVDGNEIHAIASNADFSNISDYQKVSIDLSNLPALISSSFDGDNIHLISAERYFVMDNTGYVVFYTPGFNNISFSSVYASREAGAVYTISGQGNQLFKMHEGRWARFPVNNVTVKEVAVDHEEQLYIHTSPDNFIGKYTGGNVEYFTYGEESKRLASAAPVFVDRHNVKWAVVSEGIVRLP